MKDISPRKSMAMGDGMPAASNYPTIPYPSRGASTHPDAGMDTSKVIKDGSRGHAGPVGGGAGRMATPGKPDHGPHDVPKGW